MNIASLFPPPDRLCERLERRPIKIVQEAIALLVFGGYVVWALGEPLSWRQLAAFLCIMGGGGLLFAGR